MVKAYKEPVARIHSYTIATFATSEDKMITLILLVYFNLNFCWLHTMYLLRFTTADNNYKIFSFIKCVNKFVSINLKIIVYIAIDKHIGKLNGCIAIATYKLNSLAVQYSIQVIFCPFAA